MRTVEELDEGTRMLLLFLSAIEVSFQAPTTAQRTHQKKFMLCCCLLLIIRGFDECCSFERHEDVFVLDRYHRYLHH